MIRKILLMLSMVSVYASVHSQTKNNAVTRMSTSTIRYVNVNATGANTGVDWANAYTDLQTALAAAQNNDELWLAAGVYHPHVNDRDASFIINRHGLKIYGGFAGTETQLSERIVGANATILSGDLQGNDVNVSGYLNNYFNTTRNADNSYHVIKITSSGNNLVLDGLTISDAHNNKSATEAGGAILKNALIKHLTLRNCIVKDNVSRNSNAGLFAEFALSYSSPDGFLIMEGCQFINNMSRIATGAYIIIRNFSQVDVTISNSLFDGNITSDLGTAIGYSGSSVWLRHLGVSGTQPTSNFNFINNTLVNNIDTGTGGSITNTRRSTLGISRQSSGLNVSVQAVIANSIFWGNRSGGNAVAKSISQLQEVAIGSIHVVNSIDENNFVAGNLVKTNTSDANPLFRDAANSDFSLQAASPGVDAGFNTVIPAGVVTDLNGNPRIFNATVDMGPYEYNPTLGLSDSQTTQTFRIFPNPTKHHLYVDSNQPIEKIEVYNYLGQQIMSSQEPMISTGHLRNGVYLLKIYSANAKVETKRFVKE